MTNRPSIRECDRILTASGQVLEIEEIQIDGKGYRVWKNAPRNFRTFLIESLRRYKERAFISAPIGSGAGRELMTFGEVHQKAEILAAWMHEKGLRMGDRIAIAGSNSAEYVDRPKCFLNWIQEKSNVNSWVVAFTAIHLIGGIGVYLNAMLPKDQLLHCLNRTKPSLTLVDEERELLFSPLQDELRRSRIGPVICWSSLRKLQIRKESLQSVRDGYHLSTPDPQSDAVIFFSSGTSGAPKAVLSTQRMALTNLWSGLVAPSRAALRAGLQPPALPSPTMPQKAVLLAIPLFHVTGCLSWLMRAFFAGSKIVMMRKWDVNEAIRLIEAEGVTVIGGVPTVVASILQSKRLPSSRSFETVFYGGALPSKELAREVKERWPKTGLYVVQGYGLTETNAYVCSIAGQDYVERPDSTGPVVPVSDIRVIDPESRKDVAEGKLGLLLVRGPQVMKCYYGDEGVGTDRVAATRIALDEDGWFDTGDMAQVDQDGFIYIRDRRDAPSSSSHIESSTDKIVKDIIIRGGENITTSEVENALYSIPTIAEAVVIGVPDRILGEVVGAIVGLREGQVTTRRDILLAVAERLPRYAVPSVLVFHHGPLPRNANGKIVKKDLRPILIEEYRKSSRRSKL